MRPGHTRNTEARFDGDRVLWGDAQLRSNSAVCLYDSCDSHISVFMHSLAVLVTGNYLFAAVASPRESNSGVLLLEAPASTGVWRVYSCRGLGLGAVQYVALLEGSRWDVRPSALMHLCTWRAARCMGSQ
jgi:hypothetical protein